MAGRISRRMLTFVARNYKTWNRTVEFVADRADLKKVKAQPHDENAFVQSWYLSLQGEDSPTVSAAALSHAAGTEQKIYRYDWAFGVAVPGGFWWDWQDELRKESAIAVHILLEAADNAPEMVPVAATLSALHPSRNTKSLWETTWPKIPRAAADLAKAGAVALPPLEYASGGLMLASNVLDSYSENQKNWFLYQFFDDNLGCATVEWRINKQVLREYGPLLRGTLYAAFYGSTKLNPGQIRLQLRPQIGYMEGDQLAFIVPTDKLKKEQQIYIEIKPKDVESA
jgi:hypothetical protein